jgi:isopropylmalate/homocitrate/citramalate synthase
MRRGRSFRGACRYFTGARQIECTIKGIGERAGNAALEEVVMLMKTRHDKYPFETKIVTEHLYPASQLLTSIIDFGPQPNKPSWARTRSRTKQASIRTSGQA